MDRNDYPVVIDVEDNKVATREGGVDRNNSGVIPSYSSMRSPPARVAWIETDLTDEVFDGAVVATREGGVDRNNKHCDNTASNGSRHPRGWRG